MDSILKYLIISSIYIYIYYTTTTTSYKVSIYTKSRNYQDK